MISYDDLAIFVKVAQQKSISNAAKLLGINYTTVSRRIKMLEESFGQRLLSADRHIFTLTNFGQQLYNLIINDIPILDLIHQKITNLISSTDVPNGLLKVQLPVGISLYLISPFLHKFMELYPNIDLQITYENNDVDVVNKEIDIALLTHITQYNWQKSRLIAVHPIRLYCSKIYADNYGIPYSPEDLKDHLVTGGPLGRINDSFLDMAHIETGKVTAYLKPTRLSSNSIIHNIPLLNSNKVIIACIDAIMNEIKPIDTITLLNDYYIGDIKFYIVRNHNSNQTNVNAFIDFLITCLQKN